MRNRGYSCQSAFFVGRKTQFELDESKTLLLKGRAYFIPRRRIEDSRGYFYKVIDGKEMGLPEHTGEVYLTMAKPGEAKGGHFHPKANEWFTLLQGTCLVKLLDMETREKQEFQLDAERAESLFIGRNIAHVFINESATDEFLLLAYTDQLFDPSDTIAVDFAQV